MAKIYVGISGWTYAPWRGSFYPEGLKQKDELAYASQKVTSIEINGTFYSMQSPKTYATWYEQTPASFAFALKGPRYLTHIRRLKDFATPLSNFLASGLLSLREKLGPILWQFPPNLSFDPARFEPFMAALPHDTEAAAQLAVGHSEWLKGKTVLETDTKRPMRHAIEIRNKSFDVQPFVDLARRYNIAIVVGDTAGRWPLIEDLTSDFVYIRMHGDEATYPNGYTKTALERWAKRYGTWVSGHSPEDATTHLAAQVEAPAGRDVFAYFDNDIKETAPFDAVAMMSRLGLTSSAETPAALVAKPAKAKAKPRRKRDDAA